MSSSGSDRDQLRARLRAALRSQSGDRGTDNTAAGDTSDRLNTDASANSLDTSHFGEVPFDALRSLAQRVDGAAGNGAPLADIFSGFSEDTANRAAVTLLSGLTQGPVAIASDLANVLSISQSRALTIARTELLGSYRDAQLANYAANSDVVGEWMWSAAMGSACIACTEMDGQTFPLDQDMIEHVCGRCSPLPVTKPWDDILGPLGIDTSDIEDTSITANYQSGHDWFLEQSDATQLSVLGPAKFSAWQQGDLSLGDLVGQRTDGAWGGSIYEKSLKELGLNARDYLPFSNPGLRGLGTRGGEAVQEARAAVPPPSLEPVRVQLPDGSYTYMIPGDESQFASGGNMDAEARAGGWQSIDDVLAGLRGEPTMVASAVETAEASIAESAAEETVTEAATGLAATPYAGPTDAYVQAVADNLEPRITQYAALHPDMTLDEYKAAVAERLQQLVSGDMAGSVRVPSDVLDKILDDGRLKSSFEAGKRGAATLPDFVKVYNDTRVKFEQAAFGYAEDLPAEMRPISGYITQSGKDSLYADSYGDARLILSDEAAQRATMTFGDSLDYGESNLAVPRPVGAVSWDAYAYPSVNDPVAAFGKDYDAAGYQDMLRAHDPLSWQSLSDYAHANGPMSDMYAELQIHGGVSLSDIDHIVFDKQPSDVLVQRLDKAGIKWTYEPKVK